MTADLSTHMDFTLYSVNHRDVSAPFRFVMRAF